MTLGIYNLSNNNLVVVCKKKNMKLNPNRDAHSSFSECVQNSNERTKQKLLKCLHFTKGDYTMS